MVRFTAPASGRYWLRARFYAMDPLATAGVNIQVDRETVWQSRLSALASQATPASAEYSATLNLRAGAVVDAVVSDGGDYFEHDQTGLEFDVRQLPGTLDRFFTPRGAPSPYSPEEEKAVENAILAAEREGRWRDQYRLLEEASRRCSAADYLNGLARCEWALCYLDGLLRDFPGCAVRAERLITLEDRLGNTDKAAQAREMLGAWRVASGRRAEGEMLLRAAMALREHRGDYSRIAVLQGRQRYPGSVYPLWEGHFWDVTPDTEATDSNRLRRLEWLTHHGFPDRALSLAMAPLGEAESRKDTVSIEILWPVQEALGLFEEAEAGIARLIRTQPPHPGFLVRYGLLALNRGDYGTAGVRFAQADRALSPWVNGSRQEFEQALDIMQRRLSLRKRTGNWPSEEEAPQARRYEYTKHDQPTLLLGWARLHAETGQPQRALPLAMQAFAIQDIDGPEWSRTLACQQIGRIYEQLGDAQLALYWYLTTRQRASKNFPYALFWIETELDCARAFAGVGRYAEAEECYQAAAELQASLIAHSEDPLYISGFYTGHDLWAQWAGFRLKRSPTPAENWEALMLLERGKALWTANNSARPPERSRLSASEQRELTALRETRNARGKQLRKAVAAPKSSLAEIKAANESLRGAEAALALFLEKIIARHPEYRQSLGSPPPTAADLKELARRQPDTLFLNYAITDADTTLCFALSHRRGLQVFRLKAGEGFWLPLLQKWRQAMLKSTLRSAKEETELAAALYRALFTPLEKAGWLSGKDAPIRLSLIADGVLRDLPFAALQTGDRQRLIQKFPITMALSLGLLTAPERPVVAPSRLVCLASPLISPGVTSGLGARKTSTATIARQRIRGAILPLKFAANEQKRLQRLFPQGTFISGRQATETALKNAVTGADLLHFATHARADRVNGLRSWLLLSEDATGEDNLLEASEVPSLPLTARLAVLSACETGTIRPRLGNGLLGFAWAFSVAGCPSVVASQWEVDDAATGLIMEKFYALLKQGQSKDVALQQAMLAVMRQPGTHRPFYWAAWQVIGSNAALFPQAESPSP